MAKHFLLFLAICSLSYGMTETRAQQGFLSIDCGRTQGAYTDNIGLSWDNDKTYIRTGKNSRRSFKVDSTVGNYKALGDFRYFPEGRSKYCYELPTTEKVSYLIRAVFYYDDAQSDELSLPIQFTVSVGGTTWFTVTYDNEGAASTRGPGRVEEGIFYVPGNLTYFCLQPVRSVPFISSLELRELDLTMYTHVQQYSYLSKLIRYNFGPAPIVRYPDDEYDRLWQGVVPSHGFINVSFPHRRDANLNEGVNRVPAAVMLDAMECSGSRHTCGLSYYLNLSGQVGYVYAAMYFEDLNASESGVRGMYVSLNGEDRQTFNVTDHAIMQVYDYAILETAQIEVFFTSSPPGSTSIPIVNALEVYEENIFDFSTIATADWNAVVAMKSSFNLTDWQGDPCTTVPYDWLKCSRSYHDFFVTSITLSHVSGSGLLMDHIDPAASMMRLAELSITYSDVNELTFEFLINNFTNAGLGLTKLDLSYNAIKSIPKAIDRKSKNKQSKNKLAYLNLSHNALEGQLSSFMDMQYFQSLQELNLSSNNMTSLPNQWPTTSRLKALDLSHNKLAGNISSLDVLVWNSALSMRKLDISDNNLSGSFSSLLYFSNLTSLEIANFDRNQIQGVLNLSAWHESLQQAALISSASLPAMHQLFSFVNNSIFDIYPSAEVLQPTIDILLNNNITFRAFREAGVFLGGNPYCKAATSQTQRYLCRFTIDDPYIKPAKEKNWRIIVGIVGGTSALAFVICCIFLATIWNLWSKVSALRQIQQALADQKVHPPFYSYAKLKSATNNFHKNNKLGTGTFGVVYKGVLVDSTTLAVKKLFNSQQVQVLDEFLNEVVLITGIKHRNLVQLKGCCIHDKQRILVYEHVENGNLAEALWGKHANGILNWRQRFKICAGVASGLAYLHEELEPRIIHRDIKPANILLDNNFNPKIADFGLARSFLDDQSRVHSTHLAGTMGYWAPEYAIDGHLTDKADVFSFGTLALEIVSGRKCIDYNLPPAAVFLRDWAQKLQEDGKLFELLQLELRDNCIEDEVMRVINIALVCVDLDPKRRATMSQVVTMLLGSMDVADLRDNYKMRNFDGLSLLSIKNDQSVESIWGNEESDESPLLDGDRRSPFPLNSNENSRSSVATIELGAMGFQKMKSLRALVGRSKGSVPEDQEIPSLCAEEGEPGGLNAARAM